MSLHGFALSRPVAVTVFFSAVSTLGIVAVFTLPVDFLPPITLPRLAVRILAPGVPLQILEAKVTTPVEAALEGIAGTKRTSSWTRDGAVVVLAELSWAANVGSAMLEARERLEQLAAGFPRGTGRPVILRADPATQPVLLIAVSMRNSGGGGDRRRVATFQQDDSSKAGVTEFAVESLRSRLARLEGVGMVSVVGGVGRELEVCVNPRSLPAQRLCIENIVSAIRESRTDEHGGAVEYQGLTLPIRVMGQYGGPDELESLPVWSDGGTRCVRLGDVASVRWSVRPVAGVIRLDGKDVVELRVHKEPSGNAVRVAERVQEEIRYLEKEYPEYRFAVVNDDGVFIRRSVDDVMEAIVLGGLLSVVVLLVSLRNWVDPLAVGLSLPISILATVFVMQLLDIHLNVISLAGLALGVGMLGDNGTIVAENTRRLIEEGKPFHKAILEGAGGVNLAVTASTLTNIAVFLPVLLLDGVASRLFAQMAATMTIALLVSLVVAVTIVPLVLCRFPGDRRGSLNFEGTPVDRMLRRAEDVSRRRANICVRWSLGHTVHVLAAAGTGLIAATLVAFRMDSASTPSLDNSCITVSLDFPHGTSLHDVRTHVIGLESVLARDAGVFSLHSEIGIVDGADIWNASFSSAGHVFLTVRVHPDVNFSDLMRRTRKVVAALEKEVHGLRAAVRPRYTTMDHLLGTGTNEIAVRIIGVSDETSDEVTDRVVQVMRNVQGVVDLIVPPRPTIAECRFLVDERRIARLGIDASIVVQEILSKAEAYGGVVTADADDRVPIRVLLGSGMPDDPVEELLAGSVKRGSRLVPVRSTVEVQWVPLHGEVYREDRQRVVIVTANVAEQSTAGVIREIQETLEHTVMPRGSVARVGMFSREAAESTGKAWFAVLLSLVLVYVILAVQYESYVLPLVVLLSSPLAFVGSIAAMVITGEPLTVVSIVGLAITVGAVDNDAVVAVDIIAAKMRQGENLQTAIIAGMDMRLRPIVVTSATTVMGFLPLLFQAGSGSAIVRALATPLAGGIIASTLATILVIPAAVLLAGDRPYQMGRKVPSPHGQS